MPWSKLKPVKIQSDLYRTPVRLPLVQAGRGSGKSEITRRRYTRAGIEKHPKTDTPMYFYALPTYSQAKRVAWAEVKKLAHQLGTGYIERISESDLCIYMTCGAQLWCVGLDKPQRIEGAQWCGGVMDECADIKPGTFDRTIEPALTHFDGWLWRIGVPKRYGIGAAEFNEHFDLGVTGSDPEMRSYHWKSAEVLAPEKLARLRNRMDERDFREQFEASREQAGGAIFYAFQDDPYETAVDTNIDATVRYDPSRRITIGSDFNVSPMSWVIGHRGKDYLDIFDEISLKNTNTQETLEHLYKKHPDHKAGWDFFGDASARARKTPASSSDLIQIRHATKFERRKVYYLKSNPPLVDRFAACNAMLRNANGRRRIRIHPRCKNLIKDLNSRAYKEGTREPNDGSGANSIGHMSDALGYIVSRCWPLRSGGGGGNEVILSNE